MVYVGLSYYGPSLGTNEHLSFFLSAAVEIPSYMCCWLVMDRWGRRWPLCLCMVVSGICCIITVLLPPGNCFFFNFLFNEEEQPIVFEDYLVTHLLTTSGY